MTTSPEESGPTGPLKVVQVVLPGDMLPPLRQWACAFGYAVTLVQRDPPLYALEPVDPADPDDVDPPVQHVESTVVWSRPNPPGT